MEKNQVCIMEVNGDVYLADVESTVECIKNAVRCVFDDIDRRVADYIAAKNTDKLVTVTVANATVIRIELDDYEKARADLAWSMFAQAEKIAFKNVVNKEFRMLMGK
jgi:hypothetical protein